jgi:integrase
VHVEPRWGTTRVSDIRFTEVLAWVSELASQRGPVTVKTTHCVLARILDDAVRDRLLAANPARGVKLLTAAQLHALAREARRYGSLVLLLGTAGLRWGEAAALRVCDIDFLRRRIELRLNAVTVSGKGAIVGTLKSGKARTVALAGFVVDELAAACEGKGRDELIWPSATSGYLATPDRLSPGWRVRSHAPRRQTRRSPGPPRMPCGIRPPRWRSRRGPM